MKTDQNNFLILTKLMCFNLKYLFLIPSKQSNGHYTLKGEHCLFWSYESLHKEYILVSFT